MNLEKSVLDFIDGLSKVDFDVVIKYSSFVFLAFWIVVVAWVWIDSGERSDKIYLRILATLCVLIFNIPGLLIYLILRPKMTLQEQYWSDLERRYLMYETAELTDCMKCGNMLQPGFVYCPYCKTEVKVKCSNCGVNIDKRWENCPFCGDINSAFIPQVKKVVRYETFKEFVSRKFTQMKEYKARVNMKAEIRPLPVNSKAKKSKKKSKKNKKQK
ncbi:MAG: hypothetical protein UT34_C0001G0347 [candidate division WS6 bacterium GW2011_GWF2_39_15]|uniref:DZANK-type domain-containing protein n=1 Tax=candidate division WS6 bacterium GW2011_GWF2_39_15 TaxID=1619100 RepID=A0A0G0QXF7_9BACT|nr:MAG: hypothetical protein UT34_C0001G0347 [candidate division WS6 bacterium GW2011_GWF2_39_15]